jgi:hypothetical protein
MSSTDPATPRCGGTVVARHGKLDVLDSSVAATANGPVPLSRLKQEG